MNIRRLVNWRPPGFVQWIGNEELDGPDHVEPSVNVYCAALMELKLICQHILVRKENQTPSSLILQEQNERNIVQLSYIYIHVAFLNGNLFIVLILNTQVKTKFNWCIIQIFNITWLISSGENEHLVDIFFPKSD